MTPDAVLDYWFTELTPGDWFRRCERIDRDLSNRFLALLEITAAGESWHWRVTPRGRCAEIIVLDQFSRNIFRDEARAFAQDAMALALAQEAVAAGDDLRLPAPQRHFCYMPYMHSESLRIHDEALRLFAALGDRRALYAERRHRQELERFGRYPARNRALGRATTPAERAWLEARRPSDDRRG